ncbi:MAG TPA: hypothetical protein DGT21_15865 [Armatimonadetes bacterium]|jgi:hypothetical protein|nr:hypothetical protein [Armatimonadota bacterium]
MSAGSICRACRLPLILLVALGGAQAPWAAGQLDSPHASVRRDSLIRHARRGPEAMPRLILALGDEDMLVRRTAVTLLARLGETGLPGLRRALTNDDVLVRRNAALCLGPLGSEALPLMERALRDGDPLVRQAAVMALLSVRPRSPEILATLRTASNDPSPAVLAAVSTALQDYLEVTWEMRLPGDGWKFMRDPDGIGEQAAWYATGFDDSAWGDIGIGLAWGSFGHQGYIGNGWYRRSIDLPANPGAEGAFMRFGGVDECARVWLNGVFVGEHNMGPSGWDKPFQIDVSNAIKWGEANQITVLAWNTAAAGGIWQPVHLMAATGFK